MPSQHEKHQLEHDALGPTKINHGDPDVIKKLKALWQQATVAHKFDLDDYLPLAIVETIQFAYHLEQVQQTIRCCPLSSGNPQSPHSNVEPMALKWDTRENVARSLKFILHLFGCWAAVRKSFVESMTTLDRACVKCNQFDVEGSPYNGAGYRNNLALGSNATLRTIEAAAFSCTGPSVARLDMTVQLKNIWNGLRKEADGFFTQSHIFMYKIPEYMDIKKRLPLNGRLAYSLIMACHTGRRDRNKPEQHRLFGWCFSTGRYDTDAIAVLKRVGRAIDGSRDDTSKVPPAVSTGQSLFKTHSLKYKLDPRSVTRLVDQEHWDMDYTDPPREHPKRLTRIIYCNNSRIDAECTPALFSGNVTLLAPSMIKLITQAARRDPDLYRSMRIWVKMCQKVMKVDCRNDVTTILTGPPEHVQGDDYMAPCIWSANGRQRKGWILMRRNWNDVFHMPDSAAVRPAAHEVTYQLDTSSRYYFDRQRDAVERAKTYHQRVADMLRKLRALPLLCREDSYAAGNCTPGTEQFIEQLSLTAQDKDRKYINGRELAKVWRSHKYVQMDRLGNVVKFLWDRVQKEREAEAARQEAVLQVREETRLNDESPAEFTVERPAEAVLIEEALRDALQEIGT